MKTPGLILNALLLVIILNSCKKEMQIPDPAWFSAGRYVYDFETDTSLLQSRIALNIHNYSSYTRDYALFEETIIDTGEKKYSNVMSIFPDQFIRKPDGLYTTASNQCSFGSFGNVFEYLVVPANSTGAMDIPQYGCGHAIQDYNRVLTADTLITVPAGTYHTICILHANGDKVYWSREVGVILYEQYQNDKAFPYVKLATLKLRSKG